MFFVAPLTGGAIAGLIVLLFHDSEPEIYAAGESTKPETVSVVTEVTIDVVGVESDGDARDGDDESSDGPVKGWACQ